MISRYSQYKLQLVKDGGNVGKWNKTCIYEQSVKYPVQMTMSEKTNHLQSQRLTGNCMAWVAESSLW